ncbi:unnamed protein product [Alternaria alternata]
MSFGWETQDDGDGVEDELDNIKNKKSILIPTLREVIAVDAFDGFGKEILSLARLTVIGSENDLLLLVDISLLEETKAVTGSSDACPIVAGIAGLEVIEAFQWQMPLPGSE